jgi:hypothetical protein
VQARTELEIATLIFWAGALVRESLKHKVLFLLSRRLVQRQVNLAGPFPQLLQRRVADNRGQPSSHLRLSPELADMSVSREEGLLHGVLGVSCIPQNSQGTPIKRRQAE